MQWNDFLLAIIAALLLASLVFSIYYLWIYRPADTEDEEREE